MYDSLYIHVPFCRLKCDYCAFYSLGNPRPELQEQYLRKLEQDARAQAHLCNPLRSVFFGGGTPTALSHENLRRLTDIVSRYFIRLPDCEWTSEANPESLDQEAVRIFADAGVNRISMGVQSFIPEERSAIGRRGSLDQLPDTIRALRENHISNLNLDLIYLIPGQTPQSFTQSLNQALKLNPTHLSAYALTLEEHTPLARRIRWVDDERFLEFWHAADRTLAERGLKRYEISNFARPGFTCRHNDDIWHGTTYLGLGPAATSFDGTDRFTQPWSIARWLGGEPPDTDRITPRRRACEILAFGMRTLEGWNFQRFKKVTGQDARDLRGQELQQLHRRNLITLTEQDAKPTEQGLVFNDDVLETLI